MCIWASGIHGSGLWSWAWVPTITISEGSGEGSGGHGLLFLATEARRPCRARGGVIFLYGKLPKLKHGRVWQCALTVGHQGLCIFITI